MGDFANLLCEVVREASPAIECEIVLDELAALRRAVSQMVRDEVIVLFYEKLQPIQKALQELAAEPIVSLPARAMPTFPYADNGRFRARAAAASH